MEVIETKFTITKAEYVRAMRRHHKTPIQLFRDVIAGVFFVIVGLLLLLSPDLRNLAFVLIVCGTALLAMIGYIKLLLPIRIYNAAGYKLQTEYWMLFREDGFRFRYRDADSSLKWSLYSTWLRDNEFYILYQNGTGCSVIPRRAFLANDDEKFARLLVHVLGPPLRS
jgi:hypothetical protein